MLCDGMAVTTVEGIGCASKPHAVQERIAGLGGSQCGFCTPGHVMSMYSLLRENKNPSAPEVEACLDGNICRCTGYRGIHAAFHTFAGKEAVTNVDGFSPQFSKYSGDGEPQFPEELRNYIPKQPIFAQDQSGTTRWYRVLDLSHWAQICKEVSPSKPRVVVGSTSVGVFGQKVGKVINVDVTLVSDLEGTCQDECGNIVAGGAESLNTLISSLRAGNEAQQTLAGALTKLANNNVRNAGGWAGNLVMGRVESQYSGGSDGAVLLSAFGASVKVAIAKDGKVEQYSMTVANFVRDMDLNNSNYLLVSIEVPAITAKFTSFRQSMSKVNSHAIVNAAFRTEVTSDGCFQAPILYAGCIQKRAVFLEEAGRYLEGKPVCDQTLSGLLDIIQKVTVDKDQTYVTGLNPGGKDDYKKQLLLSFVFKWFVSLVPQVPSELRSVTPPSSAGAFWAATDYCMSVAQTLRSEAHLQLPEKHPGTSYVGPKKEALEQACGQLKYSGDMPMGPRGLYGVYVVANDVGKLLGTDASEALKQEGVVAFLTFQDVPGMNSSSMIPGEEPVFAEDGKDILYAGAPVGLLVAGTDQQAKTAARMVKVNIGAPQSAPIYTIDEAVDKKQFLYGPDFPGKMVDSGNVDEAFADASNIIIEGSYNIAGQNNFYMERNTAVALPDDMGRIMIYGGAQCPDATKTCVMMALGSTSKDVVVKVRPMGGAFGGKFTRNFAVFCAAGVACKKLGRPVRIATSLITDMGMHGNTRHIVKCHYKVAVSPAGMIVAFDNKIFIDAGCSNDYTDYIADEIVKRQDNAYHVPNYRAVLNMCKTNNPTASANRAPGLMQAAAITETILDHIARKLSMSAEHVRELNLKPMQNPMDTTGNAIIEWNTPKLWQYAKDKWEFDAREKAHAEFNASNRFKKRATSMMPLKFAVAYLIPSGGTVTVNVNAVDGTVAVQTGCCEMGQGCLTKVLSTTATELGIPIEKVSGFYPDTSVLPNLSTDGGSAGAEILCHAAKWACEQLKERLVPVEAELIEELKAAGVATKPSWEQVVRRANGPMPTDTRTLLSATAQFKVPKWNDVKRSADHPDPAVPYWNWDSASDTWQYHVTGVACSDVEVDVLTGDYTILRADVLVDAGHSLNPFIDLGQAEGGFVYGIGAYCREEILMDPTTGRNKCEGMWNYKPPTNKDVPQIFNVELAPGNKSSRTAYGSKGVGEAPLLLAYSVVSAMKKAILSSRLERGLSSDFTLDSPATVDRVQKCMSVSLSDLNLEERK
ncbi:unnamed protein product [Polarella glacialis]|uniref:FAD-binding PCMH-type domain-containing protein n=1 Tax=Polarella glacialis TaxID=89957 RepID=A0A813LF13_POLGL|nr:unnamed protein product [Polarella glacialis]